MSIYGHALAHPHVWMPVVGASGLHNFFIIHYYDTGVTQLTISYDGYAERLHSVICART